MLKLSTEQKSFFKLISDIAFLNPFSTQREQADCALLNITPGKLDLEQRKALIQEKLAHYIDPLKDQLNFSSVDTQKPLAKQLRYAWLFYQYHTFQQQFNAFIIKQQQAGDAPIELPFGNTLIERFKKIGFNDSETAKYIALFYQLYRGFYFIDRDITGNCPAIVELRMRLWNNIFTFNPQWYLDFLCGNMDDFSTLLLGQTGTGKSLVAQTIGHSGYIPFDLNKNCFKQSFNRSFQSINLAEYPVSLLESELFGHKKGAFTGAIENHPGLFSRCSAYGAVFIDEIGDIDIPIQVKLLNVIQDRTFSAVGSHQKQRFAGRVISATNRNIEQLRQKGLFRDDLYYRLCSDVITVPSLQQRIRQNPDELIFLVGKLLERITQNPNPQLTEQIEQLIVSHMPKNYHWPGNVRELEQCIRQILLTGRSAAFNAMENEAESSAFQLKAKDGETSVQDLQQQYCRFLYHRYDSYEAVARITRLDRRTVKKHIMESAPL